MTASTDDNNNVNDTESLATSPKKNSVFKFNRFRSVHTHPTDEKVCFLCGKGEPGKDSTHFPRYKCCT